MSEKSRDAGLQHITVLQLFKRAVDGSLDSRGPEVDKRYLPFTPIQVGNRNVCPQEMSGYQSKAHNNHLYTHN